MVAAMHDVTRNMDQTPFFKMLRPPFDLRPFMLELKRVLENWDLEIG